MKTNREMLKRTEPAQKMKVDPEFAGEPNGGIKPCATNLDWQLMQIDRDQAAVAHLHHHLPAVVSIKSQFLSQFGARNGVGRA